MLPDENPGKQLLKYLAKDFDIFFTHKMTQKTKPKIPGRCIFCESTGLTAEHIWPVWSHELLLSISGRHPKNVSLHSVGRKGVVETSSHKERQGPVINKKIRAVCGTCNGGWMSALEVKAKPILTGLIRGDLGELGISDQETLSQWVTLKTMVCEQNKKDEVVFTEQQRHQFRSNRNIPKEMKIWMGRTYSGRWLSAFQRASAYLMLSPDPWPISHVMTANKNVQTTAIGLGQLFVYVMTSNSKGLDLSELIDVRNRLIQVWPTVEPKILVPLHRWISEKDADIVAGALNALIKHERVIQMH